MWNEKENYQCFEHSLDSLEAQTSRERVTPNTIATGTFAKPYTNIYLLSYNETSSPSLQHWDVFLFHLTESQQLLKLRISIWTIMTPTSLLGEDEGMQS